eukprot:3935338-Rhodomonas_salina.2
MGWRWSGAPSDLLQVLFLIALGWNGCAGSLVWGESEPGLDSVHEIEILEVGEIRLISQAEIQSTSGVGPKLDGDQLWLVEISWQVKTPGAARIEEEVEVVVEVNSTELESTFAMLEAGNTAMTELFLPRYGEHRIRLAVSVLSRMTSSRAFVIRPECEIRSHSARGGWEEFMASYERFQDEVMSGRCPRRFLVHHVRNKRGMGNQMIALASSFLVRRSQ